MKARYEVLDGLRGVAALSVFLFHFPDALVPNSQNPLLHSYLAVDFFFILSGFVLGFAYDKRMSSSAAPGDRLNWRGFLARRLIRLQPLLVVGVAIGLLGYLFDPFVDNGHLAGVAYSFWLLALNVVLSLLALPAPSLPASWGAISSIDSPEWSLFDEYLANVLYGFLGSRIGKRLLVGICAAGALTLIWMSWVNTGLEIGWAWENFWGGPVRVWASFSAGLLIYRLNLKFKVPRSFPLLSAVLIGIFVTPELRAWHGQFEALCVLGFFPLVVMAGAGETLIGGSAGRLCRLCGRVSYPVYIIHYPFVLVFVHWDSTRHPSPLTFWLVGIMTYFGVILLAWLLAVFYDEPVRAWLGRRKGFLLAGASGQPAF
jgi:peptidoglycan/LPS O-acetylase OafA/YrhL